MNARRSRRRLRVGYVSPDFRQHVVRQFFEAVLAYHDRSIVETFCYAENFQQDAGTKRIRRLADHWTATPRMTDYELARRIHNDRIDVLVDLAGHTANNRLGVFVYRPAPVQATYLGYFASTGVTEIDYWITDWVLHPPSTDEPAVERIFRLPRCAFGYGIPGDTPPRNPKYDLATPRTFGYVNNLSKAGRAAVHAWCEILRACPTAKLLLRDRQFGEAEQRSRWRAYFARRGIDPGRVDIQHGLSHAEYLRSLQTIDIALDPFPRTGGTTTADCLWMGVPVVTLAGTRYVGRISASKLTALGLQSLIASTPEEYITIAINLANDTQRLVEMKTSLRDRMAHSPLCDTRDLTRALEAGYREMWHRRLSQS